MANNDVMKILGASNHSQTERQTEDFYATPPAATDFLLSFGLNFTKNIIEPAVGMGHISDVLEKNGHTVEKFDIIDRGSPNTKVQDFLTYIPKEVNTSDIITNPPYKKGLDFVKHSLDISADGVKVAMFLKLQFLEGQARGQFFKTCNPKYVYITSARMMCAKDGDFTKKMSSAVAYAWIIWEKGFVGDTIVRWFNN